MLTIAEALEMEFFATATVVAGHDGLHKSIQWVHMVDIPDMVEWAGEGELFFTTAFGLKDNADLQATLIPQLVERGVVGMVVAVGRYFHEIPPCMVDCANQLGFPIVKVPWEVPFMEVTRAISEQLVRERYRLMQQSLQIHNTLTRVVLLGEDLEALARALAELVRSTVTIEDAALHPLAHAPWGEAGQADGGDIPPLHTPSDLLDELERRGILKELRRSLRPMRIPALPDLGFPTEHIATPIVVSRQVYGYMRLIVDGHTTDDLAMIALEHGATVAALILLKEQAVYEAEQRLKGSFLDDLLEGRPSVRRQLAATASYLGHSFSHGQQIMILRQSDTVPLARLNRWAERTLAQRCLSVLLIERGGDLVLLLPSDQTEDGVKLANRLRQEGEKHGYHFSAGVGRAYQSWERLSESYAEAREALELAPSLPHAGGGIF